MIKDAIDLASMTLIKPFEGYAKRTLDGGCSAYPDPGTGGAPWTIGWGSTGPSINPSTVWTLQQAEISLNTHLTYFTTGLLKLSPTLLSATDARVAALISFVYNLIRLL